MDFRFSQFEIFTGLATALLCLYFIAVFSEVGSIEDQLSTEISQALEGQDLYWSGVEVDGQQVVLTGAVPDVPAQRATVAAVKQVFGVVSVDNQLKVIGETGTCQTQIDTYLGQEKVRFKTGKAQLAQDSFHTLDMLAMILRKCDTTIEIAGHTDAKGDAEVNLVLSQRRAEVVSKRLVQLGVHPNQLRAVGYGENQPIADNASEEGRAQNRRIEFRVLGETA